MESTGMLPAPPLPAPAPKKKSKGGWWAVAIVAIGIGAIANAGKSDTDTPAPVHVPADSVDVGSSSLGDFDTGLDTGGYHVTASMVVGVMSPGDVRRFCTGYFVIGNYNKALRAFKVGYASGPPSAEAVFDELLSRC